MNAALDALATELYVVIDDLLLDHPHLAPPRPSVGIAPQLTTALTGPNRFEVGAMDPDDATDPAQQPSAEIIELVGVYHGSYGRRPGRASRTGRAEGVLRGTQPSSAARWIGRLKPSG